MSANTLAIQLASSAWQQPETETIEMDVRLAQAFAEILDREISKPRLGCATTFELLDELRARAEVSGYGEYSTVNS